MAPSAIPSFWFPTRVSDELGRRTGTGAGEIEDESSSARRAEGSAVPEEVDQHVAAERLGRRREGASAVHARDLLDEGELRALDVEREHIDRDPCPRAPDDFGHGAPQ